MSIRAFILALCLLAVAACTLIYSWNLWTFDDHCLTTTGQLSGDHYTKTTTHHTFTSSTSYDIAYKYQVNGSDYTGEGRINNDPATLPNFTVYYNPSDPGHSTLDNGDWVTSFAVGACMAAIALFMIVGFIVEYIRSTPRA